MQNKVCASPIREKSTNTIEKSICNGRSVRIKGVDWPLLDDALLAYFVSRLGLLDHYPNTNLADWLGWCREYEAKAYLHPRFDPTHENAKAWVTDTVKLRLSGNFLTAGYGKDGVRRRPRSWKSASFESSMVRLDMKTFGDSHKEEHDRFGYSPWDGVDSDLGFELAISKLESERDREVMRLRFVDELYIREIAERIGVTHQRVSQIIKRCCSELKGHYEAKAP